MDRIWGGLKIKSPTPNQQILENSSIQVVIGIEQSFLAIRGEKVFNEPTRKRIEASYSVLCRHLALETLTRLSARVSYIQKYATLGEANETVRRLSCVKWPSEQVFGQDPSSPLNAMSFILRFQDEKAFSIVDVKSEQIAYHAELDPIFAQDPSDAAVNVCSVDFDRGTLGEVDVERLRISDWLDGFVHVMRRDIDKVVGGNQ